MKKESKRVFAVLSIFICLSLTACSEKDFDASAYVKSSLDAAFHQEYKEYATFLEISEKEAKENLEQDFQEQIEQEFAGTDQITEEGIAEYAQMMSQVRNLAKYEVKDAKKDEDGNYTVKVKVEPSDIYQTLQQSATEVSKEKIDQGLKEDDPKVFASVLTESIQKSIDRNTYGKAQNVEITVKKDASGAYVLDDTELDKLEAVMFPVK